MEMESIHLGTLSLRIASLEPRMILPMSKAGALGGLFTGMTATDPRLSSPPLEVLTILLSLRIVQWSMPEPRGTTGLVGDCST